MVQGLVEAAKENVRHHEVGISLIEPFGVPLRLDTSYRFDQPGFYIGFGVTRLW